MTNVSERATVSAVTSFVRPDAGVIASRVRVLTTIASEYHDLAAAQNAPSGVRGSSERLPLTPHERHCLMLTKLGHGARCTCAYRTVREFERLMARMRDDRSAELVQVAGGKHSVRALRWHVNAWHIDAKRLVRHYPKARVKGQKLAVASGQEILRDRTGAWIPSRVDQHVVRAQGARADLALAGLEWIAARWPEGAGEPMLPAELRQAA